MVKMNIYVKIHQLKRQGFKKLQIAKELNIDVKTVRKYYGMTEKEYSAYLLQCGERSRAMSKYDYFLTEKLQQYPDVSSSLLYDWLRETFKEEFKPSYASVRLHITRLREREGILRLAKIRQHEAVKDLPFGYQAQVDMGQAWLENIYGKRVKVYLFCMSLSASRHKFATFSVTPFTGESFVKAHDLAFRFFGGRTHEIVYDQDRVMTISENYGDPLLTESFLTYQNYCGFSVYLCRGCDPQSKGKIEAVVKYVKNNFLKFRKFTSLDNLNSEGLEWLDRTGNGLIHNTTKLVPKIVFNEERKFLTAAPELKEQYIKPALYLVRKDNVISYRSNRYALPKGTYAPDRYVSVEEKDDSLCISSLEGVIIVRHRICRERGKLISIDHPAREKDAKLTKLHDEAYSLLGGDETAKNYVQAITKALPRYIRDQLGLLKKVCSENNSSDIRKALDYCIERELYSAVEFRDTLLYFKVGQPEVHDLKEQLPLKYASVTVQPADIKHYADIYGGGR